MLFKKLFLLMENIKSTNRNFLIISKNIMPQPLRQIFGLPQTKFQQCGK